MDARASDAGSSAVAPGPATPEFTSALLQSLVDFVALQLAEKGIAGENWVMAERGPGGIKIPFAADATADAASPPPPSSTTSKVP